MQIQPESTIDVWGCPLKNQLEIIKEIASQLTGDDTLFVKPNPKSSYELTDELLNFLESNQTQIVTLSHEISMADVLGRMDLVITVTGTIAYECLWSDKPFISLGEKIVPQYSLGGECRIPNIDTLSSFAYAETEKMDCLNELVATSYPGIISDMFNSRSGVDSGPENISRVMAAFRDILDQSHTICRS